MTKHNPYLKGYRNFIFNQFPRTPEYTPECYHIIEGPRNPEDDIYDEIYGDLIEEILKRDRLNAEKEKTKK